jgi:hypothetical protein
MMALPRIAAASNSHVEPEQGRPLGATGSGGPCAVHRSGPRSAAFGGRYGMVRSHRGARVAEPSSSAKRSRAGQASPCGVWFTGWERTACAGRGADHGTFLRGLLPAGLSRHGHRRVGEARPSGSARIWSGLGLSSAAQNGNAPESRRERSIINSRRSARHDPRCRSRS